MKVMKPELCSSRHQQMVQVDGSPEGAQPQEVVQEQVQADASPEGAQQLCSPVQLEQGDHPLAAQLLPSAHEPQEDNDIHTQSQGQPAQGGTAPNTEPQQTEPGWEFPNVTVKVQPQNTRQGWESPEVTVQVQPQKPSPRWEAPSVTVQVQVQQRGQGPSLPQVTVQVQPQQWGQSTAGIKVKVQLYLGCDPEEVICLQDGGEEVLDNGEQWTQIQNRGETMTRSEGERELAMGELVPQGVLSQNQDQGGEVAKPRQDQSQEERAKVMEMHEVRAGDKADLNGMVTEEQLQDQRAEQEQLKADLPLQKEGQRSTETRQEQGDIQEGPWGMVEHQKEDLRQELFKKRPREAPNYFVAIPITDDKVPRCLSLKLKRQQDLLSYFKNVLEKTRLWDYLLDCTMAAEALWRKIAKEKHIDPAVSIYILDRIEDVQELIFSKEPDLWRALLPVQTMHLTIIVAHLGTEEEIKKAVLALKQSKTKVEDILLGKDLNLTFHGIGEFNNQVLYVKMLEEDQKMLSRIAGYYSNELEKTESGKLSAILAWAGHATYKPCSYSDFLKMIAGLDLSSIVSLSDENLLMAERPSPFKAVEECFIEMNLDISGSKDFKPHLSFLKLSKISRLRRRGFRKICTDLYKEYEDSHFGTEVCSRIDLCAMRKKKQESGYYYCECSINVGSSGKEEHNEQEMQIEDVGETSSEDLPNSVAQAEIGATAASCKLASTIVADDKPSENIAESSIAIKEKEINEAKGQPEATDGTFPTAGDICSESVLGLLPASSDVWKSLEIEQEKANITDGSLQKTEATEYAPDQTASLG